jgi:hypothetical protein
MQLKLSHTAQSSTLLNSHMLYRPRGFSRDGHVTTTQLRLYTQQPIPKDLQHLRLDCVLTSSDPRSRSPIIASRRNALQHRASTAPNKSRLIQPSTLHDCHLCGCTLRDRLLMVRIRGISSSLPFAVVPFRQRYLSQVRRLEGIVSVH